MLSRGVVEAQALAKQMRVTERVQEALVAKAAVPVGTMTDATWAGPLAPYEQLADAFIETLRNVAAFDRILVDMLRVPPLTTVAVTAPGASGLQLNEHMINPATRLSLSAVL